MQDPGRSFKPIIIVAAVGVAILGVVVAGIFIAARAGAPNENSPSVTETDISNINLTFANPVEPWSKDENLKAALLEKARQSGLYLAFRRANPEAFILFGGRDLKDRNPRNSELQDGPSKVVRGLFDNAEETGAIADAKWLGQPAKFSYAFRAQDRATGETVLGEALSSADKGIIYWTVAWATERDFAQIKPEFDRIRDSFHLTNPNRKWAPKKANVYTIVGDRAAYSMQDPDAIWQEFRDRKAADEDKQADIKRVATVKSGRGGDNSDEAELLTFIIDSAGTPMDDAKEYLEKFTNRDSAIFGKTEFEPVTEEPSGNLSPNAVEKNTEVLRLRSRNGNLSYLIVLAAIKVENNTVFVRCRCPWKERETFEQNFLATAGSLKPGR